MKYLLDTHALIWYFEDSPKTPEKIVKLIDSNATHKYVCSASLWEIAIKTNIGKLDMNFSFDNLLREIANSNLTVLQIEDNYLRELAKLPLIHKDPFDRLVVATAMVENMAIITVDENIQKYDVRWVW